MDIYRDGITVRGRIFKTHVTPVILCPNLDPLSELGGRSPLVHLRGGGVRLVHL